MRRAAHVVPLVAVILTAACTSGGSPEAAPKLCDALAVELIPARGEWGAASVADALAGVTGETTLGWNAIVYFRPDANDNDISVIVDEIERDDAVTETLFLDQAAAFEEFSLLFADQPELLDNVRPELLPANVKVSVRSGSDPRAVLAPHVDSPAVQETAYADVGSRVAEALIDARLADDRRWLDRTRSAAASEDEAGLVRLADALGEILDEAPDGGIVPFDAEEGQVLGDATMDLFRAADVCGLDRPSPADVMRPG